MKNITHWTIKVTWSDNTTEYLYDIPNWVAQEVDSYLDGIEQQYNEEEE